LLKTFNKDDKLEHKRVWISKTETNENDRHKHNTTLSKEEKK
jgi:hypothetical protein